MRTYIAIALLFVQGLMLAGCFSHDPLRGLPFTACDQNLSSHPEVGRGTVVLSLESAVQRGDRVLVTFRVVAKEKSDCDSINSSLHWWGSEKLLRGVTESGEVEMQCPRRLQQEYMKDKAYVTFASELKPVPCGESWQAQVRIFGKLPDTKELSAVKVDLTPFRSRYGHEKSPDIKLLFDQIMVFES